ncbi:MAG: TetR/AcrR family transcriptional regulator [Deltaproteobacteria bacterium]|jgi:AcrR family transcriptional regulator|nr:TetR/AcrR family transcriptional regulator [Deltaproteobacteria bacterium]
MNDSKKPPEFSVFGLTQTLPYRSDSSKTKDVIMLESTILFAKRGYDAVSIRDIANAIKMKPSSLYNHFAGKEALFDAVLTHAEDLYFLYFKYLDEMLAKAGTLSELLDIMFREPAKMSNDFTCYAFSLIQTEQFRDPRCAKIFNETFMDYSIGFMQGALDRCVEKGLAFPFDTRTCATLIMYTTLLCINLRVHEYMEHRAPSDFVEQFNGLKMIIMKLAGFAAEGPAAPVQKTPQDEDGQDTRLPGREPRGGTSG